MMGAVRKTAKVLELRYQVVTYALMQVAIGYVMFLGGACMVALTIVRWNTGERDALICKLLRTKLQELEPTLHPTAARPLSRQHVPEVRSSDSLRTPSSGGCG